MKIEIRQQALLEILDFLYVDGLFPFPIISTKKGKLISAQYDKDGFSYRYAGFEGDYFKSITTEEEYVKLDVEAIKKSINLRNADSILTLEYPCNNNELKISDNYLSDFYPTTKLDKAEKNQALPFELKDKIPYIEDNIALDTHIIMGAPSFKMMSDSASSHGTDFYKFTVNRETRDVEIKIGEIQAMEDYAIYKPPTCKVLNINENVDVTFMKGIKQIAKTFNRDINIYLRTNMPAWFQEVSEHHRLGVLISPVLEQ